MISTEDLKLYYSFDSAGISERALRRNKNVSIPDVDNLVPSTMATVSYARQLCSSVVFVRQWLAFGSFEIRNLVTDTLHTSTYVEFLYIAVPVAPKY